MRFTPTSSNWWMGFKLQQLFIFFASRWRHLDCRSRSFPFLQEVHVGMCGTDNERTAGKSGACYHELINSCACEWVTSHVMMFCITNSTLVLSVSLSDRNTKACLDSLRFGRTFFFLSVASLLPIGAKVIFKTQDMIILTHHEKIMVLYGKAVIVWGEQGYANESSMVNTQRHMSFKDTVQHQQSAGSFHVTLRAGSSQILVIICVRLYNTNFEACQIMQQMPGESKG